MKRIGHVGNARRRMLLAAAFLCVVMIVAASLQATLHPASASGGGVGKNILSAGQKLLDGQGLISSTSGQYYLIVGSPLVVYGNVSCVMWTSNTAGTGSNNYLAMQTDGNLVLYTSTGKPLWASNTAGTGNNNHLSMQDDGNLVLYTSTGKQLWASGTDNANQLCPYAKLWSGSYLHSSNGLYKLILQNDGNLVLLNISTGKSLWTSKTAGANGYYFLTVDINGNLILFNTNNPNKLLWTSKTSGTGSDNYLVMQDDGNLVLYTSTGKPAWASNTAIASKKTGGESAAISWAEGQMVHSPSGYYLQCLRFVFDAYEISSNGHINLHAMISPQPASWPNTYPVQIWGHFNHGMTGTGANPPLGALVFWKASNGKVKDSHAALSIGGGYVITTAYNGNPNIHKASMSQFPGAVELGWWLPA